MTSCHFCVIHALHRRVAGDAGVVDQHVDRPELGFDLLHAFLAGIVIRNVPLVGGNSGALGELARTLVVAGVGGSDLHPHILERDADCLADAAGSAGYDRHSRHDSLS